ncbi:hypothetical protein BU26DRAFT_504188 [Trematosphaeria pertusa]|uniref:Uncharacterized protein n=1 Tax=Trematosphaeria pertusa TaxID=390896 RepID=A0A6A6IGM4_9PLEO|nr:uncharacterized protein BU26DRAFT_504188 [Trematosphaeria pertusa]KAF2249745.1 hypothetical protein BU26DRAFT_504188 [Trematosphaeria pertusa]
MLGSTARRGSRPRKSRVSKTSTSKHPRPRQRPRAPEDADDAPSSLRSEVVEPSAQPASTPPRRSQRLRALDGTGVAGVARPRNGTPRTRSQRSKTVSLQAAGSTKP